MRGKGFFDTSNLHILGITPACAGKSSISGDVKYPLQDHPRVCGEKQYRIDSRCSHVGSPPRVRGKGLQGHQARCRHGITPACAGKRRRTCGPCGCPKDHPRVCGEKPALILRITWLRGSPPRVRGKVNLSQKPMRGGRITPACAGKREPKYAKQRAKEDHPRVCGEKSYASRAQMGHIGSPPRVRGKERQQPRKHRVTRITPACAGKSIHALLCVPAA